MIDTRRCEAETGLCSIQLAAAAQTLCGGEALHSS